MKDKWIFYTNPMSRGQIARWALHEVMAENYEERLLDYTEDMRSAEFLKLNPMGKVPVLVHEKGDTEPAVVTETAAICLYLAEFFPEAGLKPAELAPYFRWMFFAAGPLEQAITIHSNKWDEELDESSRARMGFGNFDLTIKTLESWLKQHSYVCGKSFCMTDVYVGSHIDFGLQFGTVPKLAAFEAYCERLKQRPAYQRAKEIDQKHLKAVNKPHG